MLTSAERLERERQAEQAAERKRSVDMVMHLVGIACVYIAAYHIWGWWAVLLVFGSSLRFAP